MVLLVKMEIEEEMDSQETIHRYRCLTMVNVIHVHTAPEVHQVQLEHQVLLELAVPWVVVDTPVLMVNQAHQATLDQLVQMERMVLQDQKVIREAQAQKVSKDQLVPKEIMAVQAQQVPQVQLDPKETVRPAADQQVHQVQEAKMAHLVAEENPVQLVNLANLVQMLLTVLALDECSPIRTRKQQLLDIVLSKFNLYEH